MKVSVHERLQDLSPAARALMAAAAERNLFSTVAWYENFLAAVVRGEGTVQFVVAGESDAEPAAILPLWRKPRERPWSPRRLEALANYYTCLYEPITCADETRGRAALAAIAGHLVDDRRNWDVVDLAPMDDEDWRYRALRDAFATRGLATLPRFAFGNWYLDCAGMTFDQYFRSRGGSTRNRVRSKRKQLEQRHRVEMAVATQGEDLDVAIGHYNAVYAVSWKLPEPYPEFMPGLIRGFAREGWLRLGIMLLDGRPAAAQAWFVAGGVAYTAGTVFYTRPRMRYAHFAWHLCVMAGTACHFVAVRFYAA